MGRTHSPRTGQLGTNPPIPPLEWQSLRAPEMTGILINGRPHFTNPYDKEDERLYPYNPVFRGGGLAIRSITGNVEPL